MDGYATDIPINSTPIQVEELNDTHIFKGKNTKFIEEEPIQKPKNIEEARNRLKTDKNG